MKISIVGSGNVGSIVAYHLTQNVNGIVSIYDFNIGLAEGVAEDVSHGIRNPSICQCVSAKTLHECIADSEAIVLAAGAPRHTGQKRIDLVVENAKIAMQLASELTDIRSKALLLIVTNPVDILTSIVNKLFPKVKVVGMGCALDSLRLVYYISRYTRISTDKICAFVTGSHDEHMVFDWDSFKINGQNALSILQAKVIDDIEDLVINSGERIVSSKGRGSYISAGHLAAEIVQAFLSKSSQRFSVDVKCIGVSGLPITTMALLSTMSVNKINIHSLDLSKKAIEKLEQVARKIDKQANATIELLN